jgi:hypothetical protein
LSDWRENSRSSSRTLVAVSVADPGVMAEVARNPPPPPATAAATPPLRPLAVAEKAATSTEAAAPKHGPHPPTAAQEAATAARSTEAAAAAKHPPRPPTAAEEEAAAEAPPEAAAVVEAAAVPVVQAVPVVEAAGAEAAAFRVGELKRPPTSWRNSSGLAHLRSVSRSAAGSRQDDHLGGVATRAGV